MPGREDFIRCFCSSCVVNGGLDSLGKPIGVLHHAQSYRAHLNRVARENAPHVAEETVVAHALATALTDDGPDLNTTANRLWCSRAEYQHGVQPMVQPPLEPTDVEGIIQQFGEISFQSSGDRHLKAPSLNRVHKAERNQHTVKALNTLSSIDATLNEHTLKLSVPQPPEVVTEVESDLSRLRAIFKRVTRSTPSINQLKQTVKAKLDSLQDEVAALGAGENAPIKPALFPCDHHYDPPVNQCDDVAQIVLLLGAVCSVILGVSRRGGDFIMSVLSFVMRLAFERRGEMDSRDKDTLDQIPQSIRATLSRFQLNGQMTVYAACPKCHYTYKPTFNHDSDVPIYPQKCTNTVFLGENECGETLLEPTVDDVQSNKPIRPFVYYNFKDYMASLLSRPDLEKLMDKSCDDLMKSVNDPPPPVITNVFDGEFIRTFKGPDGERLFVDRPGEEGRFLFSLNVDFFNVEGMTIRGSKTSTGIISMACLNLPPDIRYKPENMFLAGIIPGPSEPNLTDLNHYLKPITDDFVEFWDLGVKFSRTSLRRNGRVVRCAIATVVCDLPAARKAAGLAGHKAHYFCSVCRCHGRTTLSRTDFEHEDWNFRDRDELRAKAEEWRCAPSRTEQENVFKAHGVRWSPLWCLPYWDPSRQVVVDSMHCILEGVAQFHFRDVLCLTKASANIKDPSVPAFVHDFGQVPTVEDDPNNTIHDANHKDHMTPKEIRQVTEIHSLLTAAVESENDLTPLKDRLSHKNLPALKFVCQDLSCVPKKPGQRILKWDYINALVEWRKHKPFVTEIAAPLRIATPEVMQCIRDVVQQTTTPSWFDPVPPNFGDPKAGSLKAAEWRSFSTVYLPLALVKLWGEGSAHATTEAASRYRQVLDHTMALVSAVTLACTRITSSARAATYRQYMATYLKDLVHIHPDASYRTNLHMAIHIFDFLVLFGPVHSWWCFPFERLIGLLQRLPSNHKKFGELEATLTDTFVAGGKLRQWLARPDCPQAIKICKKLFDKAFTTSSEARHISSDENRANSDPEPAVGTVREVPDELHNVLRRRKAKFCARVTHNGVGYSTSSAHLGNSLVLFYPTQNHASPPVPGCIKYITVDGSKELLYVQRHLPVKSGTIDPFLPYPHFPAQLYSSELSSNFEVIPTERLKCHYARWSISSENVVVLSLSHI